MCDALQQLRTSFSTTIMLEDLKSFLQEEARVLEVGTKVEAIVGTLEEVRHETMLYSRCGVMLGVDSLHQEQVDILKLSSLREAFLKEKRRNFMKYCPNGGGFNRISYL